MVLSSRLLSGIVLLAFISSSSAGATCGSSCANNNQCYESSCTRCSPRNNTCIIGLPCGSICQVDTDCNTLTCPYCYMGRCGKSDSPVAPVPVQPQSPPPAPEPQCVNVACSEHQNCTQQGHGCVGCGQDNRCHSAEGFCGLLCNDDSNCAGSCPDCRDYHCRAAPVPVPVPPAKCSAYKCKTFFDCAQHGNRACEICGADSRCHTKGSICGVTCNNNTDCKGPAGSDCELCLEGKCTASTCGRKCSVGKGILQCTSPGCNYCKSSTSECGSGPAACGDPCNTDNDCPLPCGTCGGYPSGGHSLFCRGYRNSCYAPCRSDNDCPLPCGTCDEALHICLGGSNTCGKTCDTDNDCPLPCGTCNQAERKCVG